MKLGTSIKRGMDGKMKTAQGTDELECAADLELILEWVRYAACRARRHSAGLEEHRGNLRARGETGRRLQEFDRWRESAAFTEREKAALNLSEAMSLRPSEAPPQTVLGEAKRHFTRTEMISLTLAILAANDWIDAHSNAQFHVLVVEDDLEDQDLLRRQLKMAQMENNVVFVPDAPQALAKLEGYRSAGRGGDLIALFLDLRLPGMDGVELLRRIRAMPDLADLPVIVMTSSDDPRDMEECQKLKVVSYVEKPITFGSFSKAVANIFHSTRGA